MRARLAKAAYEMIRIHGHSAFRTAMVYARAGVSQGAQLHHFSTKEDLVMAALDYAFARAEQRSAKAATGAQSPKEVLAAMIEDFKLFFLGDEFWVGLDITIAASKSGDQAKSVVDVVTHYRAPVYALWGDALHKAGWSKKDAQEIVTMSAAMVSGLSMRGLWMDIAPILNATLRRWITMAHLQWPLR